MPIVRIDLRKNPDVTYAKRVGVLIYNAMHTAIGVPEHDNFQILTEHDEHHFIYDPEYLGIQRTDNLVIIQITLSTGRTLEQKIPAIRDVHHVHTWSVGPHETLLTMHALVNGSADQALVLKDTKVLLAEHFGITHATIQIEVEDCVDKDCAEPPPIKRARG